MNKTIEVVAALIVRGDRFLACQRPADKARALQWEFPGGKIEPGESGPQALVRECREELGVTVRVLEPFMDVTHDYPELTVHLTLYVCETIDGDPVRLEHNDIRFITVDEMDALDFCPADRVFCAEIKRRRQLA